MSSKYVEIIRQQNEIIKRLEKTTLLTFLSGLSLGLLVAAVVLIYK
jgi:tetrahydromethanopterin S-methyltransferase subunit F